MKAGETGYIEGQNVAFEFRWAEDQFRAIAGISRRSSSQSGHGDRCDWRSCHHGSKGGDADDSNRFNMGGDPVQLGLVASLARPGGNLTGVTTLGLELEPKRLELMHELLPTESTIALLVNPESRGTITRNVQAAARTLGLNLHFLHATNERDLRGFSPASAQLEVARW